MWPEIEIAQKEKRREIALSGAHITERIQKKGLDPSIYNLTELNFLSLTGTSLSEVSSDISKLSSLQTLILHSNKIQQLSEDLTKLTKLKHLDLSCNCIVNIPDTIGSLLQLATLNLSHNKLISFPALLSNSKLAVLDLSHNNLATFPNVCSQDMTNLSELKLQGNEIDLLPSNISTLPVLKVLDLNNNKLKALPGELSDCLKLKELNLKSNPIGDRRLLKLINQCRTKQIIDYVNQNCPRTTNGKNGDSKREKKGSKPCQKNEDSEDETKNEELNFKHSITIKPADESFKVVVENSTKAVREHIVCCLVNNVTFNEDNFKDFIKLQNKLHDGICNKRNAATIATHDFKKLNSTTIKYKTSPPKELRIKPLNRPMEVTGAELFTKLQTEANNLRKEKKRSCYSGIHKYLYLIEGKSAYPCLVNDAGDVISFPPITNSDISKIELITKQMFIEVTSSTSQLICKTVLTDLLKEMAQLFGPDLQIQQVRVLDEELKLKLVYPSKNDLKFDEYTAIKVIRE
ncbi:leucine-rich repeat-containing protein 47-like [Euwallacea fornicatus]|uniref:leucine-rich repeat-containing protein 47-like n=1 Tax=Euwallacea fornicatus TaxID=995702 RepID=UPI00338E3F9D